jgi:hypothetical protein
MQLCGVVGDIAGVQDGSGLRGSVTVADSEPSAIANPSSADGQGRCVATPVLPGAAVARWLARAARPRPPLDGTHSVHTGRINDWFASAAAPAETLFPPCNCQRQSAVAKTSPPNRAERLRGEACPTRSVARVPLFRKGLSVAG